MTKSSSKFPWSHAHVALEHVGHVTLVRKPSFDCNIGNPDAPNYHCASEFHPKSLNILSGCLMASPTECTCKMNQS